MSFVPNLAPLISASRMSALAAIILLCSALVSVAQTQSSVGELQVGKTIEREITTDDVHSFEVGLEENQLLEMVVGQRGIDVVVKVFAPDGKMLGAFDTPNGTQGPEAVSIVAAANGKHRIELVPFGRQDGGATAGRYEARIVALREATKDEIEASKSLASLQPKALELLDAVVAQTQTLRLGTNRSMLLAQAADLMWEHDERRARALFAEAMKTLQDESKAAAADTAHALNENAMMMNGGGDSLATFRQQTLQLAARHDVQLALDLARDYGDAADSESGERGREDSDGARMKMSLAFSAVAGNPAKAFEIAEKSLSDGATPQHLSLLSRFKPKDSEIAAKLAAAVAKKVLGADFNTDQQAREMAMSILRFASDEKGNVTGAMNRMMGDIPSNSISTTSQKIPNHFSEQSLQGLAEALVATALNARTGKSLMFEMQPLMPLIEKYAPARAPVLKRQAAEVTRKLTEFEQMLNPTPSQHNELGQLAQSGTTDEILTAAPKAAPEMQTFLYGQAAQRLIQQGDLDGARGIIKNISDAGTRSRLMMEIDRQTIEQALKDGKAEQVRRLLPSLRTDDERANILSRLAIKLAGEGKKEQAKQILAEARDLIGGHAANTARLNTQLWIARSYLEIEPSKSYDMVETTIDRFNELTAAAATLDGFLHQGKSFKDGEVVLGQGGVASSLFQPYTTLLNSLARFNFERARAVVERIQRPEIRVVGYMLLAQGVLRPQGETPSDDYGY